MKLRTSRTTRAAAAFGLATVMTAMTPLTAMAAPRAQSKYVDVGTSYSHRAQALTAEFNSQVKDVKIVVMDRDWFQANIAYQGLSREESPGQSGDIYRAKMVQDYIYDRSGVKVPMKNLLQYGVVESITQGEGFAMPAGTGPTGGLNPGVCMVFGEFADSDAVDQTDGLLNARSGYRPALENKDLKNVQSVDNLRSFVNYHEIGHCLYHGQVNKPGYSSMQEAVLDRNRSEMYADIMSTIFMAHYEGVMDGGQHIADMRMVGDLMNGPVAAHFYGPDQYEGYGPAQYAIGYGGYAAHDAVNALGLAKVQSMNMDEMRALGHKILKENELDMKKIMAMMMMYEDDFDLKRVDELAQRDPSYSEAYKYVAQMRFDMAIALQRLVDVDAKDLSKNRLLDQIVPDYSQMKRWGVPDEKAQAEYQEAYQAAVLRTRDELVKAAGGATATEETLLKAFVDYKEKMRSELGQGTEKERYRRMAYLGLAGEALSAAVFQLRYPDKAPPTPQPKTAAAAGGKSAAIKAGAYKCFDSVTPQIAPLA